jgi:hypothetical protein
MTAGCELLVIVNSYLPNAHVFIITAQLAASASDSLHVLLNITITESPTQLHITSADTMARTSSASSGISASSQSGGSSPPQKRKR